MLNKVSKLLVLLATLQFANASENIKQNKQVNINITGNINIYQNNQGTIFNNSNNNNNITIDIHGTMDKVDKAINNLNLIEKYKPQKTANRDPGDLVRTQIKIIKDNVPTIVNNLNIINDSKYISLLRDIKLIIPNQYYRNQIYNKINDLEKPIVGSITLPPNTNKTINVYDLNDDSRGVSRYMNISAQSL